MNSYIRVNEMTRVPEILEMWHGPPGLFKDQGESLTDQVNTVKGIIILESRSGDGVTVQLNQHLCVGVRTDECRHKAVL